MIRWLMNLKKKGHYFGLIVVVFFLPYKMILSTIGTLIYVLWGIFNLKKSYFSFNSVKANIVVFAPVLYFFVIFIGLIYSSSIPKGLLRINTQLSLLIFPICISFSNLRIHHLTLLKKVFLYSCIVFCCISILTLLYSLIVHFNYRYHYNFVQSSMYHFHFPYDALYINFAYILLLFGTYSKFFKRIITLLFLSVILLFGVRIGLFSFLLITIIYITLNIKKIFNIKNLFFLGLLLIGCFFILKTSKYASDKYYDTLEKIGFNTKDQVSDIGERYHNMGVREVLWNSSLILIKEKPFFGYGTGNNQDILDKVYVEVDCKSCIGKNSHNQYLTTLLNYGALGLAVLIFIMVYSLIRSIKTKNLEFLLFLVLILIAFSTESILVRQKGVMFFSLFLSVFLVESTLRNEKHK